MFTIGHSTHALDDFLSLLRAHGVVSLADVRRHPGSRRLPWFSSDALAAAWSSPGDPGVGCADLTPRVLAPPVGSSSGESGVGCADLTPRVYAHVAELGGRRSRRPDSPNTGWTVKGFAGYADHMATEDFERGLRRLLALPAPVAVMCAEGNWWQCHRRLIADALVARGHRVLHIGRDGRTTEHALTAFAVVEPGEPPRLTYPGGPGS